MNYKNMSNEIEKRRRLLNEENTIKKIVERIKLWQKYLKQNNPYEEKQISKKLQKKLGLERPNLISDQYYSNECAKHIIRELKTLLYNEKEVDNI